VLFFYTQRDESELISTKITPDLKIGVVGKQWSWDFNYLGDHTYETGTQAQTSGDPVAEEGVPVLWLPVGKRVQFELTARDVIHSFWIPAFLMKMDTIPGIVNEFQVVPQVTGTYKGKCAELCGEYHAQMRFTVKVVTQAQYEAHMQELRQAGQVGRLPTSLGRSQLTPEGQRMDAENGNS
jgi:cytochrome c oxidase subunit II